MSEKFIEFQPNWYKLQSNEINELILEQVNHIKTQLFPEPLSSPLIFCNIEDGSILPDSKNFTSKKFK